VTRRVSISFFVVATVGLFVVQVGIVSTQFTAQDPGVRGGVPGAGDPIAGLSTSEINYFNAGKDEFEEEEELADGLGPRMNLGSCVGCHTQPATGGTSPAVNPQV